MSDPIKVTTPHADNSLTSGKYQITTYPYLLQQISENLPQILLNQQQSIPELSEHNDYQWLDVTDSHSTQSYRAFYYMCLNSYQYAFENKVALPIYRSFENDHIISLQADTHYGNPDTIVISDVALKLMMRYLGYTVDNIQPPQGINRPRY